MERLKSGCEGDVSCVSCVSCLSAYHNSLEFGVGPPVTLSGRMEPLARLILNSRMEPLVPGPLGVWKEGCCSPLRDHIVPTKCTHMLALLYPYTDTHTRKPKTNNTKCYPLLLLLLSQLMWPCTLWAAARFAPAPSTSTGTEPTYPGSFRDTLEKCSPRCFCPKVQFLSLGKARPHAIQSIKLVAHAKA